MLRANKMTSTVQKHGKRHGSRAAYCRVAGASLIELSCAIFLVTTGMFGGIHLYMQSLDRIREVNEYEAALCALSNELETLRALPYHSLTPGYEMPFRSSTPGLDTLHLARARVTIIEATDESPGLKQVTAAVRWVGAGGRIIERELVTLVADTGETRYEIP